MTPNPDTTSPRAGNPDAVPAAPDQPEAEIILGIDLGTTNSLVAVADQRGPRILEDDATGQGILPSVVRFPPGDAAPIVGVAAREHAVEFPEQTVYSVKRLMGKSSTELSGDLSHLTYEVIEGDHNTARVRIGDNIYSPPQISAIILKRLREIAQTSLNRPVRKAVVTVPAYFDDAQRQATRDAGRIAGLDVVRIINEPTAAALAYGLERKKDERIAVFDFGGGTFDISILDVGDGVFEVKATSGNTHLGGDNLDQYLIGYIADEFQKQQGIDLRNDQMALQRLKEAAEAA